jgi:hypothetical protein
MRNLNKSFSVSLVISVILTIAGCEKQTVSVSMHGVNYSGNPFSYFVYDVVNQGQIIGGEHIAPFSGGGITCCAMLPKKWEPGTKLKIRTIYWLPKRENGTLPEVKEEHFVDVPPYVGGTPGELWILRGADGKVSVVSSDFQPDHPQWPGVIKGWPIPSIEYRRERWEQMRKLGEENVHLYVSLLEDLNQAPQERAKDAWEHEAKYHPESLLIFSGPDDRRFIDYLRARYTVELKESQEKMKLIMEMQP